MIALNGTSSSGKSTLAAAIQDRLGAQGQCWVIVGIDDFLGKVPAPWMRYREAGAHAEEGVSFARVGDEIVFRAGPVGRAILSAYRGTVAALARSGLNVIVDEVVLDEEAWAQWESELGGLDPYWVRVDCPLEVCEQRERERGDRLQGLARSQAAFVHRAARYRLSVDTSAAGARALAEVVVAHYLARGATPSDGVGEGDGGLPTRLPPISFVSLG
ncbi:MAG: chloramphenicol phosphotransferase, partial [Acidimicrobiaceae bacterium]|nr:chloramphenicol phosphotransferase [Acidimicrobiaceae bacterium]